jgi:tRNA(adenine34) deaminase
VSDQVVDELWMRRALDLAEEAGRADEVPVGAVLVSPDGRPFEAHNGTRELSDPTAHAEMLVLRKASDEAGDWRLLGYELYVTLEPCAMCAGAIVLARLDRLVFGASDPKAGMCGSLGNIVQDPRLNHRVALTGGMLADEAGEILRRFFQERR